MTRPGADAARAGPARRAVADLPGPALSRRARLAAAFACGLALTAAQPPVFAWPLVFVAYPALAALLWRVDAKRAFWTGWAAGFGFFLSGLYWIAEAFFVDAARHGWMAPFAVSFMAAGLALFWGAAAWAARASGARGLLGVLALATAWTAAEYARAHVLTGFPWALPSYAFADTDIVQLSAHVGPHGLGFGLIALACAPAWPWLGHIGTSRSRVKSTLKTLALYPAFFVAQFVVLFVVEFMAYFTPYDPDNRFQTLAAPTDADGGRLVVRVVQPNAAQDEKWDPDMMPVFFDRLIELSRPPWGSDVDVVVWPETAVPQLLGREPEVRAAIAASAQDVGPGAPGTTVLVGARRYIQTESGPSWRNSLFALGPGGEAIDVYDKHHLVPFGEYLPLHGLLSRLDLGLFVGETGGFDGGPGPTVMRLPGLPPVAPQICYETIFPHQMPPLADRPDWIVQVTNDAWFGASAGPWQHFHQARMRAIEQGLPVIRSANTGISAIIDARGRVVASVPLLTAGAVQAPLPRALPPTLYARHGDRPFLAALLLSFILIAALRRRAAA
ncbi:MAG: apolipoprotein N-acyltransferase [Pseudomonadota bacterium]